MTVTSPPPEMVSFVVIAHNEEHNIEACLVAILGQVGERDLDVVVVDDASTDRTPALVAAIAAHDERIRLLRHDRNRGRGHARHTGIAAARGELVAMVDSDVRIPADWLERSIDGLDGADAVGGIPVPDGDVTFLANRFGLPPKPCLPTIKVSGTNGLYRRAVFEQVPMDPDLTEGEDVALNKLAEAAGLRFTTLEDLVVDHCEAKGFRRSVHWLYESGIGASRQLYRYREVRPPDLAYAGSWVAVATGLLVRRRYRGALGLVPPFTYVVLVAALHARSKFDLRADRRAAIGTVAANSVLIGSYFAGRTTGICALLRPSRRIRQEMTS